MNQMNVKQAAELLKKLGRDGDSQLVHVTSKEIALLKKAGGRGTVNPSTGLLEFADDSASSKGESRGGNGAVGRDGSDGSSRGGTAGGGASVGKGATMGGVLGGVAKGASLGSTIGGALGPAGSLAGGVIGGAIGGVRAAGFGTFGGFGARAAASGTTGNRTSNDRPDRNTFSTGSLRAKSQVSSGGQKPQPDTAEVDPNVYQPRRRARGVYNGSLQRPTLLGV